MVNRIILGDCLEVLKITPTESIDCVITSPPYWGLRDYEVEGQLGLEKTPEEYVAKLVEVFREVRRVLKKDGTCWLNLGDSYFGSNCGYGDYRGNKSSISRPTIYGSTKKPQAKQGKPKDMVGIPWRVAFALQADGWYLRQDIIWAKPNPMPESVTDRCTKSHEYIFLLTKSPKYYFDNIAIQEPLTENSDMNYRKTLRIGRKYGVKRPYQDNQPLSHSRNADEKATHKNRRSVWTITTKPYKEAHFATFPEALIIPMVKAGCPEGGVVLDPFMGSGTTAYVARKFKRNYLGIELNKNYIKLAEKRLQQQVLI